MPPTTSRDFQRAAAQRLNAAETLLREKLTLDAQYLSGYAVECSLKALILELTPDSSKADKLKEITAGRKCIAQISSSVSCEISVSRFLPRSRSA